MALQMSSTDSLSTKPANLTRAHSSNGLAWQGKEVIVPRRRAQMQKQLITSISEILAGRNHSWEEVRSFMRRDKTLNPNHVDTETLVGTMHRCAYDGETEVLGWCLNSGADVNLKTTLRRTPLHYACDSNKAGCVRLLLEHGADVNFCTLSSLTPLHICCQNDSYEASLELLHGVGHLLDVDSLDAHRRRPEDVGSQKGKVFQAIQMYRGSLEHRKAAERIGQALKPIAPILGKIGQLQGKTQNPAARLAVARCFPRCSVERAEELTNMMHQLCDLETSIFEGMIGVAATPTAGAHVAGVSLATPHITGVALKRSTRPLLSGARVIIGMGGLEDLLKPDDVGVQSSSESKLPRSEFACKLDCA